MKRMLVCLFIALTLLAVTGCGASGPADTSSNAPATDVASTAPEVSASAAQEPYEIAVVVKQYGAPWFAIMEEGVNKAAEDFNVNAYETGPADADAVAQVQVVDDLITKGVDAIVIVPNSADSLQQSLAKAKEKGIPVITNEAPGMEGITWDYEMLDNADYAKKAIDQIAEKSDGKGEYVMFVGGLDVPLHNIWADLAVEYQQATYPDMKEVTSRIPCAESVDDSYSYTTDLMQTYPNLAGVIGWGSQGPIGAAKAVRDAGRIGEIVVTGCVVPSQAKEYLDDGSLTVGYLWNPSDAGYYGVYACIAQLEGLIENGGTFTVPGTDVSASVNDNIIQFNTILTFTKETVGNYDF